MNEFLLMDGYASYVWSCFGVSLLVLGALVFEARRGLSKTRQSLARRLAQEVKS